VLERLGSEWLIMEMQLKPYRRVLGVTPQSMPSGSSPRSSTGLLSSEDSVHDGVVVEFSHRVHLHEDARMETLFDDGKVRARVGATLKGGETIEQEVPTMKGEAENPMRDEEDAMKIQALIASSPFDRVRSDAGSIVEA
jgi:2-methylcitrate dehydratase PrpD